MANILGPSEKAVHFIGFQSDRKQEKTARNQRKYNTKYNVQAVKLSNEIGSSKAAAETDTDIRNDGKHVCRRAKSVAATPV